MKQHRRVVLEELSSIKDSIKKEIEKEKEALLSSCDKGAIKFFLDSIGDDIKEMIETGFTYKQQLEIINRSSGKNIKYATYTRYIKEHLSNNVNRLRTLPKENRERQVRFSHEALPDVNELY